MAATGFTPIKIYASSTASSVPLAANLDNTNGAELAINTADGRLFYKDSSGVVQTMASKATGAIGGSTTQVQFNNSGVLGGSANLTFNGTTLTAAGLAGPLNGTVGATTPAAGTFTALSSTSGALNGTIGATTANTGNFTTLTTSSTITDNGGTANGVTYLNGSKVVTSGSALTFDGTNLILGSANPLFQGSSSTGSAAICNNSAGAYIRLYGSAHATRANYTDFINGSSTSTFDSAGNLGIGTSSPTSLLQTAGTSAKSAFKTPNIAEVNTVSATAASGTIQYDVTTQSVLYYTSNASANWTVNFRGSSGTSLNTVMQTGESISVTFLATQGATAYYNSAVTIDGTSVTPKWQGGTAPTSGNASSIDSYNYVIIKVGSGSFTVLASVTKFA